ncbi:hypothetical protein BASA81_003228 [Batrachochytrium salamandrivorans]|nr:hypothetical protein BASA81_003228 [Batrachochytrium salamandrivorans]
MIKAPSSAPRLHFVSPKNPANGFHFQQQQQQQQQPGKSPLSPFPTSALAVESAATSKSVEMFPPIGLVNTGATCFFNASLQCLFACPAFCELMIRSTPNSNKMERDILDLLALHFVSNVCKPGQAKRVAFTIHPIFKIFRQQSNGLIRTGRQEDSHEALVMLFDQMEKAVLRANPGKYTPARNPINDVFGCALSRHIVCPQCKYESKPVEPNVVLSLEIRSANGGGKGGAGSTAQQLVRNAFATSIMDKDNKWECGGCKRKVQAETFYSFASFPETLILHLKRFAVNRMGREEKLKTPFFIQGSEELEFGEVKYDLVGVLVHQGSRTSSGHYYSFVRINKAWRPIVVKKVETPRSGEGHGKPVTPQRDEPATKKIKSTPLTSPRHTPLSSPRHTPMGQLPKPVLTELLQSSASPIRRQQPSSTFAPLFEPAESPAPSVATSRLSVSTVRTPAQVKRRFASIYKGRIWKSIRARMEPFTRKRPRTVAKSPVEVMAKSSVEVMAKSPVEVITKPSVEVATVMAAAPQAPASASAIESFLPTTFSFDIKPKKKFDFGDAWDELLDQGKVKKTRRV